MLILIKEKVIIKIRYIIPQIVDARIESFDVPISMTVSMYACTKIVSRKYPECDFLLAKIFKLVIEQSINDKPALIWMVSIIKLIAFVNSMQLNVAENIDFVLASERIILEITRMIKNVNNTLKTLEKKNTNLTKNFICANDVSESPASLNNFYSPQIVH